MKNSKFNYCFILLLLVSFFCLSQNKDKSIIKVTYYSTPVSQYNIDESYMKKTSSKPSKYEIMNSIKDFYTLYIDLSNRASLYVLDSTQKDLPKGTGVSLADKIYFTIKTSKDKTYKHEWVLNQTLYSEGTTSDIEWELTEETKNISGLECFKATTKNKDLMLTAWYTKKIPVSSGPSIYQGLPGLVVWVEDFFRTTQVSNVEYIGDRETFENLYNKTYDNFKRKENKKYHEKEPILMIKKSDAANQIYQMIHGKAFKGD